MKYFIVLPNLLFEKDYFKYDINSFILYEHPVYFGKRKTIKMKFNKLKLILHRASMKFFQDYLEDNDKKTKYIDYNKKINFNSKDTYYVFDPVDKEVEEFLRKKIKNLELIETPNFLTPTSELDKYAKKNKKFFHSSFYKWQVSRLDIPYIKKSYDTENRKKIPDKVKLPKIPNLSNEDEEYINKAKNYVKKHFDKNYGNYNLQFPVTHKTSKKWFREFLNKKLKNFGIYQDAITTKSDTNFHSLISPMLNIGLLNPKYVLDEIVKFYKKNKKVGINNYEGFVRQLIGWREYQRMIYMYKYDEIINENFFKNKRNLSKHWYDGTLGIDIVDDSIKAGFNLGYLHHIIRLMVMSNFMNLCNIKPVEAYKWFMEFSVDSYDWVMIGNVYSMGFWADGGLTMRKPYISSSNYVIKMSNYKKNSEWTNIWTALYYYFLYENRDYFKKSYYKNSLNYLNKNKDKNNILKLAKKFIKEKTI